MTSNEIQIQIALLITVLEIGFGPPTADFGSIWSSQKARKFYIFKKHQKCVFCILTPHNLIKILLSN